MLEKLFKYSSKGQAQQWEIVVEGDFFYTVEGLVGGKLTKSDPTICIRKNIGKANETSANQQALIEAKARWQKKLDKGYNLELTYKKKFFEPMLAHEYSSYEKLLFTVPTYVQPKLDGIRCIKDVDLSSRNGKPIVSCPHLEGVGPMLDGELYNHDLKGDFNKIISLTRKSKPEPVDLKESEEIVQYWVYDYPDQVGVFSKRYLALQAELAKDKYNPKKFIPVPTYPIRNMEELQDFHARFIGEGYEGTIIRLDLGDYENKRSKQLLKYKDFMDAEFEIVDVTPGLGNRSQCAGRLVCKVRNVEGDETTFGCSMTGNLAFMKKVLDEKDKVIGKQATVKFFSFTPDGIPRFPVLKHIHDYE
tara:strand:+ start:1222 stop:2304 length:1083 start_codon:yes stop_codon:yes gene_type:complete